MRVTVIGKQNHLFWLENVVDAFKRSGYETQKIATNKLGVHNDIKRFFTKNFNKKTAYMHSANIMEKKILSFTPNIILLISPLMLPKYFSEMIGSLPSNIIKIGWEGDRYDGHSSQKTILNSFDKVYYTDSGILQYAEEQMCNKNNFYLPLAVNEILFKDQHLNRANQLLFIAHPTHGRANIINHIQNTRIKLIGKRWKKYISENEFLMVLNKNISFEKVAVEYNTSRYVLNIKHESNIINGVNMRSFEAPCAGACLIQDYVKDVELNFSPGEDIITYKDPKDIESIIQMLDNNHDYREKIIRNSQNTVLSKHTYMHRVKTIINDL